MSLAIVVLGHVENSDFHKALDAWRQQNGGTFPSSVMIDDGNDANLRFYMTLRDLDSVNIRNMTARDVVFTVRDYYLLQNTEIVNTTKQILIIRSGESDILGIPYYHWNGDERSQGESGINYQRYNDLKNKANRLNMKVVECVY